MDLKDLFKKNTNCGVGKSENIKLKAQPTPNVEAFRARKTESASIFKAFQRNNYSATFDFGKNHNYKIFEPKQEKHAIKAGKSETVRSLIERNYDFGNGSDEENP